MHLALPIGHRADLVVPVAVGTAGHEGRFPHLAAPVARVGLGHVVVAHAAVHRLQLFLVGKLRDISVTIDAIEAGVGAGLEHLHARLHALVAAVRVAVGAFGAVLRQGGQGEGNHQNEEETEHGEPALRGWEISDEFLRWPPR